MIGAIAAAVLALLVVGLAIATRGDGEDVAAGAGDSVAPATTVEADASAATDARPDTTETGGSGDRSSSPSSTSAGTTPEAGGAAQATADADADATADDGADAADAPTQGVDTTIGSAATAPPAPAPDPATTSAPPETTAPAPTVGGPIPTAPASPGAIPGGPTAVLAVFSADRVVIEGAVPDADAAARLEALALANARPPATVVSRLRIDPTVPTTVPVRVIELESVRFPSGSAEITPEHAAELDRVANVMLALPNVTVLVVGHADQVGSEATNLALSNARAQAVVNLYISRGIAPERLSAVGVGESDLLSSDLGQDARELNRRTEFVITGLLAA